MYYSPISSNWPDVQQSLADMQPDYAERVTSMVDWVQSHTTNIETFVTSLHPQHPPCHLVTDRYTWGQSFAVFELSFQDNTLPSWILRLGMRPLDAYFHTPEQLERKIFNEAAALHIVRTRTTIPVPEIFAYHPIRSPDNPLGSDAPPFVMMNALQGTTIEDLGIDIWGGAADPLQGDESKRPILERYLGDIAEMHIQLSKLRFDSIGSFVLHTTTTAPDPADPTATTTSTAVSVGPGADYGLGPFTSAKEYFTLQASAYEKLATSDPSDTPLSRLKKEFVAHLWRAAMIPLIDPRDDQGPFPMQHGDLHHENILVNPEGGIVGVLDWDCAAAVPWEVFAVPSFELSGHSDLDHHIGEEEGESSEHSLVLHDLFNRALVEKQGPADIPSGRTLAALHGSDAGHVGSYLAYWMYSMVCDFEHTGRALYEILGWEGNIETAFKDFQTRNARTESLAVAV